MDFRVQKVFWQGKGSGARGKLFQSGVLNCEPTDSTVQVGTLGVPISKEPRRANWRNFRHCPRVESTEIWDSDL